MATLAPEIMPVHVVPNGVEHRFLDGWERFAVQIFQGGISANQSGFRLRNPSGSNIVAVVESFIVSNEGATVFTYVTTFGASAADLASILSVTLAGLDNRGPRQQPMLIASFQASTPSIAGLTGGWNRLTIPAGNTGQNLIVTENAEIPILPGGAIQIVNSVVNAALTVAVVWRERFLEEPERQ